MWVNVEVNLLGQNGGAQPESEYLHIQKNHI